MMASQAESERPAPVLSLVQCILSMASSSVRILSPVSVLASGCRCPSRGCASSLPLLSRSDHLFVLNRQENVLRAPLTVDKFREAPMAMVFRDRTYACEFQYQFDPDSLLEEYQLGDLETYYHAYNLPLRVVFPNGEHVVKFPRRDLSCYKPMLESLYLKGPTTGREGPCIR
jgi:hypothetical protein